MQRQSKHNMALSKKQGGVFIRRKMLKRSRVPKSDTRALYYFATFLIYASMRSALACFICFVTWP